MDRPRRFDVIVSLVVIWAEAWSALIPATVWSLWSKNWIKQLFFHLMRESAALHSQHQPHPQPYVPQSIWNRGRKTCRNAQMDRCIFQKYTHSHTPLWKTVTRSKHVCHNSLHLTKTVTCFWCSTWSFLSFISLSMQEREVLIWLVFLKLVNYGFNMNTCFFFFGGGLRCKWIQ